MKKFHFLAHSSEFDFHINFIRIISDIILKVKNLMNRSITCETPSKYLSDYSLLIFIIFPEH